MLPEMTMEKERALRRLMETYGSRLLRLCAMYLRDAALAEDAVQDTFVKAYGAMDSFRGDCAELTWLSGIAANTCRDYLRGAWMRRVDRRQDISLLPQAGAEDSYPDRTVLTAVMNLPARLRETVLLRYYQGLKLRETAQALSVSESQVKKRLRQANALLKRKLEGWYSDEE